MAFKERVLVWVADTELRIRLVNVINRSGKYQAIEYRNGAGALEDLLLQKPNFVLLDVDYTISEPDKVVGDLKISLPNSYVIGLSYRWDEAKRKQFEDLFDSLLVMPFDADSFEKAAEEAKSKNTVSRCEVLSFFAPKGKSGRTTLIVNLALALARATGERVGIIDAETNFADIDTFVNLSPKSTIVEAIRDLNYLSPSKLSRYFEPVDSNVYALCGAKTLQNTAYITPDGIDKLLQMARRCFRYVLVDLSAGFTPISITACEASEHVYLTAMSGGAFEIEHLQKALEIFHSLDNWQTRVNCVLTRERPDVRRKSELEDELKCPVILLPNEYILCSQAANNGRMAMDIGPQSVLTKQIDLMAAAIAKRK